MTKKSTYETKFRRRAEEKTNYRKRLALVKGGKPRLVVRKSNRYVSAQIIKFDPKGDVTIAAVSSKQLKGFGWQLSAKNLPAAYLTGMLAAKEAKSKNVAEAILDMGSLSPVHGSIPFAVLKGAIDGGLKMPFNESALPKKERIEGKHIEAFSKKEVGKDFEQVKDNILKGIKKTGEK